MTRLIRTVSILLLVLAATGCGGAPTQKPGQPQPTWTSPTSHGG